MTLQLINYCSQGRAGVLLMSQGEMSISSVFSNHNKTNSERT